MKKKKNSTAEFVKWFGPLLDALRVLGGSAKPREIVEFIGEQQNIPEEILNERYEKSGQLKFPNQLAWSKQYLVWEKFVESSKHGVWMLTKKGWDTTLDQKQAHDIFLKWVKVFQDLRENKTGTQEKAVEKIIETQEVVEPEDSQQIKPNLIEVLRTVSAIGFEHLCGRLLREYNLRTLRSLKGRMMEV